MDDRASGDIEKSVTISETGTVVTMYPNTAESVATNGTKVTLRGRDQWSEFHKCTNEMVISKAGRRMFPVVKVNISGLNPTDEYTIVMDILPVGDNRYKFCRAKWVITQEEPIGKESGQLYIHPESPATGAAWEKQLITFEKCKITNNDSAKGYLVLTSMHKYQPRIHIVKTNELKGQAFSLQQKSSENFSTHIFPETQFMSVTTYQNQQITDLKIKYNPFAKGFRFRGSELCAGSDPRGSSSTSGTSPAPFESSGYHAYDPARTVMWPAAEMTFPQQPTVLSPHAQSALPHQSDGLYSSSTHWSSGRHASTFHPRQDIQSLATHGQVLMAGSPQAAYISGTTASTYSVGDRPLTTTSSYSAQSMQQQLPLMPLESLPNAPTYDNLYSSPHSQHSSGSRHQWGSQNY